MEKRLNLKLKTSVTPVQTSLDVNVQALVARELAEQIERFEAIGGIAIVMRAHTSEIVSMVSLPTFDPAECAQCEQPRHV